MQALEQRVRELEAVLEKFIAQQQPDTSGPAFGQKFGKGSKASGTTALQQGRVVITVTSFSPAIDDSAGIAEAEKIEAECAAEANEIRRLQEQKRKLYDLFKELDRRWANGRGMSDTEYNRLMAENKNQRDDIVAVIAGIEDKCNKLKRKAASLRHDAHVAGQRIEGVDSGGASVIVTTKFDCAKVLSLDAKVVLVNPKTVNASAGVKVYTADKVETASP